MDIRAIVEEFKTRIEDLYGRRLSKLILYGSQARGEAADDSDIDLLVVLKGDVAPGEEIDRMIDVIAELNLKYGVLLSVYPVSEEEFSGVNSPLFLNARREGLEI